MHNYIYKMCIHNCVFVYVSQNSMLKGKTLSLNKNTLKVVVIRAKLYLLN